MLQLLSVEFYEYLLLSVARGKGGSGVGEINEHFYCCCCLTKGKKKKKMLSVNMSIWALKVNTHGKFSWFQ